jgi:hypothetical protein
MIEVPFVGGSNLAAHEYNITLMFQKSNWKTRILIIGYTLDDVWQCGIVEVKPFHGVFTFY